ncbi:hypothetical protein U1Q18_049142 [Sarracenia purpurea var. burkii]
MPSKGTRSYGGTMRGNARSGAQPTAKPKPNTTASPKRSRAWPANHSRPQSLCESTMLTNATRSYVGTMRDNARLVQGNANHHRHVNKTTDRGTPIPVHDHTHQQ